MKIDRLIGILTYLLGREKTTAPELAERFEVSQRTILRDIEALNQAGIPILTTQGNNGGISLMDGYKLDKSILTKEELNNILTGLKSLETISKSPNVRKLIQKMSPGENMLELNNCILIDLSSHYKDSLSEKIEIIKDAIFSHNYIFFDYYYSKGEVQRKIEPYFIQFKWRDWYVLGWCPEKCGFRLFKLNRLWNLTVSNEVYKERYVPDDVINKDIVNFEPFYVRLIFDKSVRFRLIDEYGPNCYKETEEGLLFELEYVNSDYAKSWVLSFGEYVKVLSPEDFKNEIIYSVQRISEKYMSEHDI